MRTGHVEVAPIREAVERSGVPLYVIALRLGWMQGTTVDTYRLKRRLGISVYWLGPTTRHGRRRPPQDRRRVAREMTEKVALEILDAIDTAPVEVGL